MRFSFRAAALALASAAIANAYSVGIQDGDDSRCAGMYASSNNKNDSEIRVVMDPTSTGMAMVFVYDYMDRQYIGVKGADGLPIFICGSTAVEAGLCAEADLGTLIVTKNDTSVVSTLMDFGTETTNGVAFLEYPVTKKGFYCAFAVPIRVDAVESTFTGVVEFKEKFGQMLPTDYPKLGFYGGLSLIYMTIGVVWMGLCARHWREILMVQHFISGVIFFLMVEMAFNWGYWENFNTYGHSSMGLMVLVAILNSARNSLSLFMLLIVSMGYGVVKPTLGSTMTKVLILSALHFFFGIIYSAGTMSPVEDVSAMIVLIIVIPLSLTMTSFYIWTLQSLTSTIATLTLRRQFVKVLMYKRLWRLLVFSLTVLCAFFVINTLTFMDMDNLWESTHWEFKWFLLDGWLNLLYLFVFTVIVILWRPTENNKRFGIDQLETEDYDPEDDAHMDQNNVRAAESMGLTGVKLRPQRRDYEMDDGDAAMFDIGDEDEDDTSDEDGDHDDEEDARSKTGDLEQGISPPKRQGSSGGSSTPGLNVTPEEERERLRIERSKLR